MDDIYTTDQNYLACKNSSYTAHGGSDLEGAVFSLCKTIKKSYLKLFAGNGE